MATTSLEQPVTLAPPIRSTLDSLRRSIRIYVWVEGLAVAVTWLGFAFWVSLAIDWFFEPPAPGRVVMLAIVAAVFIGIVVRMIIDRAFVPLSDANMAMLLERRYRELDDSLLTAVVLAERRIDPSQCNPDMLDHTCHEALDRLGHVGIARVFKFGPLVRSLLAAVLFSGSIAAFWSMWPEAGATWAKRVLMFSDEIWPRKVHLVVPAFEKGPVKVARGADYHLVVLADTRYPRVPESVQVRYRTGSRRTDTMAREGVAEPGKDRYQRYTYTFPGVLAPIRFDVVGGDDRVRDLEIEVVESPTVADMVLHCEPPDYMERQPIDRPVTGVMQVAGGTSLTVRAWSNKQLVRAEITSALEEAVSEPDVVDVQPMADPSWIGRQVELLEKIIDRQDRLAERTESTEEPNEMLEEQDDVAAGLKKFRAELEQGRQLPQAVLAEDEADRNWVFEQYDSIDQALKRAEQRMQQARQPLVVAGDEDRLEAEQNDLKQLRQAAVEEQRGAVAELKEARDELDRIPRGFQHVLGPLQEDRTLLFRLFDTDEIESRDPVRLALVKLDDTAPQLGVRLDGIGSAVTPEAQIPVTGPIVDDHGVAKVWFEHSLDEAESGTVLITAPPLHPTNLELNEAALEVADLAATPDQRLLISVKAEDLYSLGEGPNVGSSERWTLDVVTPERLRAILEARELVLRQRFEVIVQEVTETRDLLLELEFGEPSAEPADAPADEDAGDDFGDGGDTFDGSEPGDVVADEPGDDAVEDAAADEPSPERVMMLRTLRVQRALDNSRKNANETQGVADAFHNIGKQLVNNRVDTEELLQRIEGGIAGPLDDVADRMFPELERRLERLRSSLADAELGPQRRDLARQQADEVLLEMRKVLDRMLELESFNEALELLRKIIEMQERLGEQTQQRQKQKVRELLDDDLLED